METILGEGGAACGQICHSFAGGQGLAGHVGQNERKCNNYRNLSQFLDLISPCGGSRFNLVKEIAHRLLSWLRLVFTMIQRTDAHIVTCDHVSAQKLINLTADTA